MGEGTVYGLSYDFVARGGHYLVFADSGDGSRMDLVELELRMMEQNDIPCQLPLSVEEMDLSVRLFYRFTGKRMLSRELQGASLTMNQYFRLLLSAVEALDAASAYMLNEQHFVLKEDFIFVGPDFRDPSFVYLPLRNVNKDDWRKELADLAVYLVGFVPNLKGGGFQKVLAMIREETAALTDIKRELETLVGGETETVTHISEDHAVVTFSGTDEVRKDSPSEPVAEKRGMPGPSVAEPSIPEPSNSVSSTAAAKTSTGFREQVDPSDAWPPERNAAEDATDETPSRSERRNDPMRPVYLTVLAGMAICLLILWRLYSAFPNEGMLLVGAGIFLLAADAGFLYVRFQQRRSAEEEEDAFSESGEEWTFSDKWSFPDPLAQPDHGDESGRSPGFAGYGSEKDYFRSLPEQTTLLQNGDRTVLLSETEMEGNGGSEAAAFLEPVHSGDGQTAHKILLHHDQTVIGRDAEKADVVLDVTGLSRLHCEISRMDGEYVLKDLGSSNGTYLNGKPVVPYKSHPLQDGDRLRMIREEYVFRLR